MKPDDIIQVKFSEDLAQFADTRPVRRQPMRLRELVGLVLTATGKHPERVRERLRSGACPYNIYRYWWEGFELDDAALAAALAAFPDPDPALPFRRQRCLWAQLSETTDPRSHSVLVEQAEGAARRWFRARSFWSPLMDLAEQKHPAYHDYSYYHRADLYCTELTTGDCEVLVRAARRLARRRLRERLLGRGVAWTQLELACSRA
ncbi:MAG: hypothetical protein ACRD4U_09765 [Candidatus Acidiferrales bacterium]